MRISRPLFAIAAVAAVAVAMTSPTNAAARSTGLANGGHPHVDCSQGRFLCTEVADSEQVFGEGTYVGHDEPSLLFYSNVAGSGNRMQYQGVVPKDPPSTPIPGKRSYNFMLAATFWYGMALCDTQSYPEQISTCQPNSDSNIVPPSNPKHAGTAFMELQFYPPGYVRQFDGFSCSARQWCVAMTIDSLSINPVTGEQLNDTCQNMVGVEPVNFAYLTHSGKPQGPPNPVNFDPIASGKPDPAKALFLNQGDQYTVTLHDTAHGLQTTVEDTTSGQTGSMTASAANGFGQVKFAPNPSTTCKNLPYDFHPMYSTSSPLTRVPWAAHSYNVAFDDEIGHFDYCSKVPSPGADCTGREGTTGEVADADDTYCFPGSSSTLVRVGACLDTNAGFDGQSYQNLWPDGDLSLHPAPIIFTSPRTGPSYSINYAQAGFEADLPRIEDNAASPSNNCDRSTGAGCTRIPLTDDNTPANFYPYFSSGNALGGCAWTIGRDVPGFTTNDYGKNNQYGPLLSLAYIDVGGGVVNRFNDFRKIIKNPCIR
ncbi:MAG: hypothetical protein M3P23_10940 [Actinomycetota bacterium]|nr:hypothetical protein [Actinomycetota bacterium]